MSVTQLTGVVCTDKVVVIGFYEKLGLDDELHVSSVFHSKEGFSGWKTLRSLFKYILCPRT